MRRFCSLILTAALAVDIVGCTAPKAELRINNARQNQDNQFTAVRNFILEGVDFIVIAPTVEEGWDSVLAEVQAAGIPVIIMDRSVSVSDPDLYLSNVGSDFLNQGVMAVSWLDRQDVDNGDGSKSIRSSI